MNTEPVRESYDRLADEYARRLFHELDHKPLDRELLDRLASQIAEGGEICDMGCGPGHVARYLRDRNANVSGLDLSPRMLDEARRLNPDIIFRQGDMLALDLSDSTFAGIVAFYAIVNIAPQFLPQVFSEMHRVLKCGGLLLLSFHCGDEIVCPDELWGRPIAMNFYFFQPRAVQEHLEAAGFVIDEIIEREPYAPDVEHQSQRAYVCAHKPE